MLLKGQADEGPYPNNLLWEFYRIFISGGRLQVPPGDQRRREGVDIVPRVLVAMSGGVDSSVTAWLLKNRGYEVVGVTMQIWPREEDDSKTCCSLSAVNDARRMAAHLQIPHYVLNYRDEFQVEVIDLFVREYLAGRTPNPCIECNRRLKFGSLLDKALAMGFDYIATGHYARIQRRNGEYLLLTGVDPKKDQSYFLYAMNQHQLAHTLLPLGEYRKTEVRAMAEDAGLPVAQKSESQEICFVSSGSYGDFVEQYTGKVPRPGQFRLTNGEYLGPHRGIHRYTIGQRKGLGIALGKPVFVTRIDAGTREVWLGENHELFKPGLVAEQVNYISGVPFSGPTQVTAKIRSAAPRVKATATPLENQRLQVLFEEPQRAITPGQAVVLYDGDQVLAGGAIADVIEKVG